MSLTFPPFAAVEAIRNAAKNSPPLKFGDKGPAVAVLQGGLMDLGYKLPVSTRKTGFPDGDYGKETKDRVFQFQTDAKLTKKDGIAGKETILEMDKRLAAKTAKPISPPKPPNPPVPLPPSDKNYTLGTINPPIKPDPGAGVFNSKPTEISMWALKQSILEILPPRGSSAAIIIGVDASLHMKHYMNATGMDLTINLESMLEAGPTAKARFRDEIGQARKFVETLPEGRHEITSKTVEGAYNYKEETWNWFYAVGGYVSWGKGVANIKKGPSGREYDLQFEYHFFDRYNWDKGKSVTIGPVTITDEFMAEFHRQGLAQEFNMKGLVKRHFKWRQGEPIPEVQYAKGAGR